MRILLIADIHGNRLAFEAVLEAHGDADAIWCMGDVVSYGPCPARCIELARQRCDLIVRGNHDDRDHVAGFDIAADDIAWLEALPEQLTARADGATHLLRHTPPGSKGYIRPDTDPAELERIAARFDEDVLLFGHSHVAMILDAAGKKLVNVGTVGQPRDGDPRAQCMILEDGALSFHRVAYDLDELAKDYERAPLAPATRECWLGWTRTGIISVHGLQLGPFSQPRQETSDE